jgi:CheY-like chemotaxis protein
MPATRKRILIVDNDEDVLIALEQELEGQGFETTTEWSLPEGLETLAANQFDLLLVGDHPPELNCERLLKLLRRQRVAIPCVVLHSAARHPFSAEYLRFLGASGVACKWNFAEVLDEVCKCAHMPLGVPAPRRHFAAAS